MVLKPIQYIDKIDSPADLRKLRRDELPAVCAELRQFIVEQLASNPGHLGSSLGVVELTVALHYCYDTPEDLLVWDVGHQAYAHKILTGRRDRFDCNRKMGGLCGFPKRSESVYDAFGGGHASVSVSAALGMDVASQASGSKRKCIAVIGDGAMSGGLAFEGLNNAGVIAKDLLVILNDNEISIDPNVGALKEYLLHITTSPKYNRIKSNLKKVLVPYPRVGKFFEKLWTGLKSSLLKSGNLFEALGFRYFGTVDGNDVEALVKVFEDLKKLDGPKLLHITTVKGKGYTPAEQNQTTWHAPGQFDPQTGKRIPGPEEPMKRFQDVFGETLLELAAQNPKIVGVTPAMPTGCSMNIMQREMPDRVFDVGIAEGHAVTFSGGMATGGLMPFCNIYSSFMQRAYDNVIHDVVLQGVDVVFCLDRSGLVGEDGATHHGVFDIAYFRSVPGVIISAPMNEHELRNLMYTAQQGGHGAFVIRYPRGKGVLGDGWRNPFETVEIGRSRLLREGTDIAFLSLGSVGNRAAEAIAQAEREAGVSVMHVDLRFAKPLDEAMLHEVGRCFRKVITLEDGVIAGGVGSAVLEFFADHGYSPRVVRLGVPDFFVEQGKTEEQMRLCGYDTDSIREAIVRLSEEEK